VLFAIFTRMSAHVANLDIICACCCASLLVRVSQTIHVISIRPGREGLFEGFLDWHTAGLMCLPV
jgi:hypothetical protein